MQIIPLCEGVFSMDIDKKIHLAQKDKNNEYLRPQGHLLMAINPFLIKTETHCILLDTGLGTTNSDTGKYTLLEELEKHHISPHHIDMVLLSHLHADHIGSIFLSNSTTLTFPNAIYYINEQEYLWANKKYNYFITSSNYKHLHLSDQVCWLNEENGFLKNNIEYQITGGHTPHHQVFWIRENNETIFFGGDVAPQYKQILTKINARYDYEPEVSKQYRAQWVIEGKEKGWTFLFYHDIYYPYCTL